MKKTPSTGVFNLIMWDKPNANIGVTYFGFQISCHSNLTLHFKLYVT